MNKPVSNVDFSVEQKGRTNAMKSKVEVCSYFGKRVRAIRSKRKLTQKDLADKVGVHLSFLGDIERGKKGCSIDVAYRIAHALHVNISQFFVEEEIPEDIMDFVMFVKENSDKTLADIVKILTRYR
jgi:transcriptional regulator with XRE-family HTH domain